MKTSVASRKSVNRFAMVATTVLVGVLWHSAHAVDPMPFVQESIDPAVEAGRGNSLVLDTRDNPHIAYRHSIPGDSELRYAYRSGGEWQIETPWDVGDVGWYPAIALTPDGLPAICHQEESALYLYTEKLGDGTWHTETFDDVGENPQAAALDIDPVGDPHIIYEGFIPTLKYAKREEGIWYTEEIMPAPSGAWGLAIKVDDRGIPHVSFYDYLSQSIKYGVKLGDFWVIEEVEAVNAFVQTSLALDPRGIPHIAYNGEGVMRYATRANGQWVVETAFSQPGNPSLALDSRGEPHIAYSGNSLRYAVRSEGSWYHQEVDAIGTAGTSVSLALDAQDIPHVSYYDAAYDKLRYADATLYLLNPEPDEVWPVGALMELWWRGLGEVDVYLSVDGGRSYELFLEGWSESGVRFRVPHAPTRYAKLRIQRDSPRYVTHSRGFFTISANVELLTFQAEAAPDGAPGVLLSWETDPGPRDLAGYKLQRAHGEDPGEGNWTLLAPLTTETEYHDSDTRPGMRYRLTAVNGLGEEMLLGETGVTGRTTLAAWPMPYRGGELNVIVGASGPYGESGDVSLYDIMGRRVRVIGRGRFADRAQHLTWDGRNSDGRPVSSGIYFLRTENGLDTETLRITVIR